MIQALEFGHRALQPLIDAQERMVAECGKPKREITVKEKDTSIVDRMYDRMKDEANAIFDQPYDKAVVYGAIDELRERLVVEMAGETKPWFAVQSAWRKSRAQPRSPIRPASAAVRPTKSPDLV